jgi:hypothetical protein
MFPVRFYKTAPSPIFGAKRTMWSILRRNCHGRKLRPLLPKRPRNHFSEKHVSSLFLRNCPSHLFLGPDELCHAFRGEIVTDENFARFCLKRP